jgi:glycosyltransferase involved in cell wall biosynthesis
MNRPLRVATVITRMQAGAGGVALRGALALDRRDYQVSVIAGSGDRLLGRAAAQGLTTLVVPSLVPQISPRDDVRALRALRQLIGQGQYDIVHTHSAKAGTLGRLAALWSGVPVVVHTLHGFPFHPYQSALRRQAYLQVERALGHRSSMLLAVGSHVAAESVRLGIAAPERLRTIAPSIDPIEVPQGQLPRRTARRRLAVPPGMHVVGTVGRLDYQKAPEHFVEAIAALDRPDVLGLWIGDGPLRPLVERRAAELGLGERFVCLGERDDVPALLPALDLFVMTSRYEGLPCALIEAMTVGVPVIATAVNAVPDAVIPGETGLLVPPQRPDLVAQAIGHLLDHPASARRMADTARAHVTGGRYGPEALAGVLVEAYGTPPILRRPSSSRWQLPRTA